MGVPTLTFLPHLNLTDHELISYRHTSFYMHKHVLCNCRIVLLLCVKHFGEKDTEVRFCV
jgi:hypothetical protein